LWSSEAVPEKLRDSFIHWLIGPLLTVDHNPVVDGLVGLLNKLAKLHTAVSTASGIEIGFMKCGYGLKTKLFDGMDKLAGFITEGNTLMTGVTQAGVVEDAFDAVHLGRSEFSPGKVLGVWPPSPCQALYEAQFSTKKAAIHGISMVSADVAKNVALATVIKDLKKHTNKMSCQPRDADGNESGPLVDYALPVKDATGVTTCMPSESIEWFCPLEDEIEMPLGICGGSRHNDKIKERCKNYVAFRDSQGGLEIADWGEQAKHYADSSNGGVTSEKRKRSLGFLIPDPAEMSQFKDSVTFVNAVTNPLRTAADIKPGTPCENGFTTHFDGKDFCENNPMLGFTNLFEKASRAAMRGRQAVDVNLASGGMNALISQQAGAAAQAVSANDGSLSGTFSRMQWVVSQSESYFRAGSKDPTPDASMQLFWPAWKSRLRPVTLMSDVLEFVAGTSPAKSGMQSAAQLEND
jgi:hypothetical protein